MQLDDEFPYGQDFQWETKILLGQGSYGKVFKVRSRKDGQFYAIKQMKMDQFNKDPGLMKSLKGEIQVTSDVTSDYTVKLIVSQMGYHFTYIILELCDTDLRKELTSHRFTEHESVKAFGDILLGFQALASKGYIHRDIKPANVLKKGETYKIADFGFACKADIFGKKKLNQICGTPIYMAPQLLRKQSYTAKSDIWSLGLILYELVFGYTPWPSRSLNEYLDNVYGKPLKFPYNAIIGEFTKDFIKRSLVVEEQNRMSWEQVFQHPLIKSKNVGEDADKVNVNEYVKKMLLKIQEDVQRKNINLNLVLAPFKDKSVNESTLASILRQITPIITTHEVSILFAYLDTHKTGLIEWKVIEEKIFHIDFRESGDILSRKIDDIVAILLAQNQDPANLFSEIDLNHSGFLDYSEFSRFITKIANGYTKQEMLHMFKLFDADKNGLISKEQFMKQIMSKMPLQQNNQPNDRAKRNLKKFTQFMKWSSVSAATIVSLADQDRSYNLDLKEFESLLNERVSFKISHQEVIELFKLIDTSNNGSISIRELAALLE